MDSRARTWLGQAFEHEADHCETDEGGDGSCIALEIARQAAVAADPGEGALDDPSLRQDDEAVTVAALDDFDFPRAGPRDGAGHLRALVPGIGEYPFDEWKAAAHAPQQIARAVAILNVGGKNAYAEQQAERIDEDVALAARDLLARVKPLRIDRRAPF